MQQGLRQHRVAGAAYDALLDEFMAALRAWRPHVLLQFEDFANHNAFRLLARFRTRACCFNDDVQGTACIVLAGVLPPIRLIDCLACALYPTYLDSMHRARNSPTAL